MSDTQKKYDKAIAEILRAVKRGEKEKMDELFTRTFNHFYGYALMRVWDRSRAEDAVMAMYENVMKYIGSYNAEDDGTGWMFKTLDHIIYEINKEISEQTANECAEGDTEYNGVSLEEMYETLGLDIAVNGMDGIDRKLLYMYYFERRTIVEIAQMAELSKSAVHKRLRQIIKKLKNFLT